MHYSSTLSQLSLHGIFAQVESSFHFALTKSNGRIVCAKRPSADTDGSGTSGTSFWIHQDVDLAVVGTWGGHLYYVFEPEHLVELVIDLFRLLPRNVTPTSFSTDLCKKLGLAECSLFQLVSSTELDRWEEVQLAPKPLPSDLLPRLRQLLDRADDCQELTSGLLKWSMHDTVSIASLDPGATATMSIPMLVFSKHGTSPDLCEHMKSIMETLNLSVFDCAWGNRVLLDDPYYRGLTSAEEPTNAWASN